MHFELCLYVLELISHPTNDGCRALLIVSTVMRYGFGRHIYIFDDGELRARQWFKTFFVFEFLFHTSTSLAKFAVSVTPRLTPCEIES